MTHAIETRIAEELHVHPGQIAAAVALLDDGATVPFVARYRKEATGGLDDSQLRLLEERLGYLRELEERRAAVLDSIDEQGRLTPELRAEILAADDVVLLANAMDNGTTAGVIVWENTWATGFAAAARRAGGQLVANGRIPIQAIAASFEAEEAALNEAGA